MLVIAWICHFRYFIGSLFYFILFYFQFILFYFGPPLLNLIIHYFAWLCTFSIHHFANLCNFKTNSSNFDMVSMPFCATLHHFVFTILSIYF